MFESAAAYNRTFRPLYLFLLLGAAAAFLATGWITMGRDESSAYRERIREQLARVVSMNLDAMESLTYQFIANGDLNRILRGYTKAAELYQIAPWNHVFSAYLESHVGANPILRDAAFFDLEEPRRKPLTMTENLPSDSLRGIRSSPFFRRIVEAEGKIVWLDTELLFHDGRHSLLCGRAIPDAAGGRPLGALVLFIRAERLAEVINGELYLDGEPDEFSVGNYFNLLVGRNGVILSSPVKNHLGSRLIEVFDNSAELSRLLAGKEKTGISSLRWKNTTLSVSYSALRKTEAYLVETSAGTAGRGNGGWLYLSAGFVLLLAFGIGWKKAAKKTKSAAGEASLAGEKPLWLKSLPPRELEILLLVTEGKSNKEIAFALKLKEQTVKNYIRSIYEKIGVHDRVSATLLINRAGLSGQAEPPNSAQEERNSVS